MAIIGEGGRYIFPKQTTSTTSKPSISSTGSRNIDILVSRLSKTSPVLASKVASSYRRRKKTSKTEKKPISKIYGSGSAESKRIYELSLKESKHKKYSSDSAESMKVPTSGFLLPIESAPSIYDSGLVDPNRPSGIATSTWKAMQRGLSKDKKVDIKPERIFPEITTSPYLEKFGYSPHDPDYKTIYKDIESKKVTTSQIGQLLMSPIYTMKMRSNLKTVSESPADYRWTIGGTEYSKGETMDILKEGIKTNVETSKQIRTIPTIIREQKKLKEQEKMISTYQKRGYEVDITKEGYKFKIPQATDVHKFVHSGKVYPKMDSPWEVPMAMATAPLWGKEKSDVLLGSASVMESPLAIGSLIAEGASRITGDPKYAKDKREDVAKFSLGLTESLQKGDKVGFVGKVATSPGMIEGVYIPTLTLGAGYAMTGIAKGASGVAGATSSLWGRVGARGGTALVKSLKIGQGALGVSMLSAGAVGISQAVSSGGIDKYDLPSLAGEMAFTFGMAYGGYKAGGKMWQHKYPPPKTMVRDVVQPKYLITEKDLDIKGVKSFKGESPQIIGGKKSFVELEGIQMPVKSSGGKMAYVEGTAKISQTNIPKFKIGKIRLGTIRDSTHFHKFKGLGKLVKQDGKHSISFSVGESKPFGLLKSSGAKPLPDYIKTKSLFGKEKIVYDTSTVSGGKTTTSRGMSFLEDKGHFKLELGSIDNKPFYLKDITIKQPSTLFPGETVPKSIGLPTEGEFFHIGKYVGQGVRGRILSAGKIFSFKASKPGGLTTKLPDTGLSSKWGIDTGFKLKTGISPGQGSVMSVGGKTPSINLGGSISGMPSTTTGSKAGLISLLKTKPVQAVKSDYSGILSSIGAKSAVVFGGASAPVVASSSSALLSGGLVSNLFGRRQLSSHQVSVSKSKVSLLDLISPVKPVGLSLTSLLSTDVTSDGRTKSKFNLGSVISGGGSASRKQQPVLISVEQSGIADMWKPKRIQMHSLGYDLISKSKQTEIGKSILKPVFQPFTLSGTDIIQESEPVVAVTPIFSSATTQAQQQKSQSALALNLATVTPTVTIPVIQHTSIFTPIVVTPFLRGGRGGDVSSGRKGVTWSFGRRKKGKRTLVKTVLADPFMVQLSQVKFGKATHMIPDKEIWKMGEKTWWRIPTMELMKEKKGKKNSNSKIALNVFRR